MGMIIRFLKGLYTMYTAIIFILLLLITFPFFMVLSLWKDKALLPMLWLCRFIALGLMIFCGIIYRFHDRNKYERNKAYVLIANHRSNLDAPVAAISGKGRVRYLAKKELLKVPVMGQIFAVMSVYVDRSSPQDRRKSVERLKECVKSGDSIFLFPEGTRNKTDQPMIDFKDGAFTIAVQTQTPILPMLYINTDTLMPNSKPLMRPGIIDVYYLPPIEVAGLTDADIPALKQRTRDMLMLRYLELSGDK
ncbi:MAG TPA: lysophospholipid acyltransferase family protein [Chitinophagales bacterium]|nr:1-acyl-sn-glycerol-3-phosphate acyltransferase [Chitinophagales bacterium]HMU69758.1 lysophospholipid acyltransferase family protein [Chitinophagales bacterium]HMX03087.1 lysophospholipid acyltransferase family protein [Chitinophagales bacterium]HMZ89840.1 lysophospholipid acyltransferase family protein [Chitinophagales bacterium]HNA58995.1 lysophospholipid acyltransferase family protein [Chitinophagales bacterium]